MIKKSVFAFFAIALISIFMLSTPAYAEEAYYFERFDVEVNVNTNYTFDVTKTITAQFNDERHGLYYYMPNYWGDDKIKYKDIKVEGAPLSLIISDEYTTLKIGDPDYTITGTQVYKISYSVQLPADSNPSLDSVYMNVIGVDHPVYTMSASVTLTLPTRVIPDYINVFSAQYGQEGTADNLEYSYTTRNTLHVNTLEPLQPYEGITVKIDLPEGYFKDVRDPFFFTKFLMQYVPLILIAAGIVIWIFFGTDKKVIPPVEINPPDVSPVEAGYIIDGEVDGDDVAAMLIFWASIGLLKIEESSKKNSYRFYRLRDMENRPKYEKELFDYIFKKDDTDEYITSDTVKTRMAQKGYSFKTKVSNKYRKGAKRLITAKSQNFSGFVSFLAYLCFCMIGFFIVLGEGVGTAIFFAMFLAIPFSFAQIWLKNILTYRRKYNTTKTVVKSIFFAIAAIIAWLILVSISEDTALSFEHASVMYFGSLALILISYFTQQMSEYGHEKYERVLGFRHFMVTAEKDWLERLASDDPQFFYDRLPYALVLGVSRVWIGKFANSVSVPPSWYSGTESSFNARTFSSAMVADFSRIGEYAVPKSTTSGGSYRSGSSSSFSSGGGFSGGGFSGGGSSSW